MAFTRNWNEASPDGSDQASSGDDEIRNLKVEISDRIKNMVYGFIAGENSLSQHFQYLQFYEQSSVSQPPAGYGRVYCKAVSGKCELFWHDEDGDEIQLTTGGKWNGAVLLADSVDEDAIELANNAALTAKDAAGTGTVNLILAGTNDLPTLPDSAEMASDAAPTEDEGVANKKYVDDSVAAGIAQYVVLKDVKTAGTNGGSSVADTWTKRTVAEITDPDSLCSVSSSVIVLSAGTYFCRISAPAYMSDAHQIRLRNTTGSTTLLTGTSEDTHGATAFTTRSVIIGEFTVAASQNLEIQHNVETSNATDGFGTKAAFTGVEEEVYTIAEFWKVG